MNELLLNIDNYAKGALENDKTGHDYAHTKRVLENALEIAKAHSEADIVILTAACLLHDIAFKRGFVKEHHLIGAKDAEEYLKSIKFPEDKITKIARVIEDHVRKTGKPLRPDSEIPLESKILVDADDLDALGSIGLIRMINFSNSQGYPLFKNKEAKFNDSLYSGIKALTLYRTQMFTKEAVKIAKSRCEIMLDFLKQLEKEIQ